MSIVNPIFDELARMKSEAVPDSPEDFDFIITSGDNLYAMDAQYPMPSEIYSMVDLFMSRPAIRDIPIYPVRGNHDGYWKDQDILPNLSKKVTTWNMPNHFYEKQFEIGPNGEKFALL